VFVGRRRRRRRETCLNSLPKHVSALASLEIWEVNIGKYYIQHVSETVHWGPNTHSAYTAQQ